MLHFRIKEAREMAGMSQKELAEKIGVAPNTFHGYESGKHDPKSNLLADISRICGVTVDFLLGLEEMKNTPTSSADDAGVLTKEELFRISAAMDQLNEEGRERVVEYAEDLAAGGRFKKPCAAELGQKEA